LIDAYTVWPGGSTRHSSIAPAAAQGSNAMFPQENPLHLLYVVYDKEHVIVALDMPAIEGVVEEMAFGNVETVELIPYEATDDKSDVTELRDSRIKDEAPGLRATRARYGAAAVLSLLAGTTLSVAATAWLGVPLMLAAFLAVFTAYLRRESSLTEAWKRNHRILTHHEDTRVFNAARSATESIVRSWPHLSALVGIGDPSPALARSLWNLSEILLARAALRDKHQELVRARTDLPADTAIAREVDDRLAQVEAFLATVEADIDVRLNAFEDLAERCQRYIREEQAIARAHKAVRSADQALGDPGPATDIALEPGNELAERTRAVLDAYRELTKDVGTE
jgi:hypothetical protein